MRQGLRLGAVASLAALALLAITSGAGASALTAPTSASSPTPAHWWKADGNALDSASHDDGTLMGAGFGSGVYGPDQAFSFTGGGQSVVFNHVGGNLHSRDFTLAFDIKTASTRFQAVWGKRIACNSNGTPFWDFREGHLGDGRIFLSLFTGSALFDTASTTAVNDGKWHLVVATRQGTTVKLYLDGNLQGTTTIPATVDLANGASLVAGVSPCDGVDGTNPFNGQLDELMIFRSAFTQTQIQALRNAEGLAG